MKTTSLLFGLAAMLWGISAAAQDGCEVPPCEPACEVPPCDPCNPCDPCGGSDGGFWGKGFTFGGWVETGIYTNSIRSIDNGPMHLTSKSRRDFQMSQLYLFAEKELDTDSGFDWGARADLVYGTDRELLQSSESFDREWGNNRHGYGMAAYQLYGTLGYKNLSVKYGKFMTPVGWEETAAKNNVFYSHSYCYAIEPATHTGVLGTYKISDDFTFNAGWTAGMDAGFANKYNDSALLTGFAAVLSDKATVYYWLNKGTQKNGWNHYAGAWRWEDGGADRKNEFFVQSLCLEYVPTEKFTYVMQYNLRNDNYVAAADGSKTRGSSYGINNHFLYTLSDEWKAGLRLEWLRDNGGYISGGSGDYYEITLGLNWTPWESVSLRPEIRYDWCNGNNDQKPFGADTPLPRREQVTGGFGLFIEF